MTIMDKQINYWDSVALTATASSDTIDAGAVRDIGSGAPLWLIGTVETTFTADGSATLDLTLVTDDNSSFSSATTLITIPQIAVATLVAGYTIYKQRIPRGFERYSKMVATIGTGPFTAGALSFGIVNDVEDIRTVPVNRGVLA